MTGRDSLGMSTPLLVNTVDRAAVGDAAADAVDDKEEMDPFKTA